MKIIKHLFVILFFISAVSACKQKVSYTQELLKNYGLSENELVNLQYYLVNDIVLYAATKTGSTTLVDGEIVINEAENVDKIVFPSGTRGIFEKSISANKISVRFENGDNKSLVFGSSSPKGRFTLQADKWNTNGQGEMQYDGATYLSSRGSSTAYISVKLKKRKDSNSSQRVVKGKKLK